MHDVKPSLFVSPLSTAPECKWTLWVYQKIGFDPTHLKAFAIVWKHGRDAKQREATAVYSDWKMLFDFKVGSLYWPAFPKAYSISANWNLSFSSFLQRLLNKKRNNQAAELQIADLLGERLANASDWKIGSTCIQLKLNNRRRSQPEDPLSKALFLFGEKNGSTNPNGWIQFAHSFLRF